MNASPADPRLSDLRPLLEAWCNGLLTPDEFERLAAMLRASATARREYRRYLNLHAALFDLCEGAPQLAALEPPPGPATRNVRTWGLAIGAAAALVTLGLLLWPSHPAAPAQATMHSQPEHATGTAPTATPGTLTHGNAMLVRAVDVVWENAPTIPHPGGLFSSEWVEFKSGVIQVDFLSGASLIIEGPAKLELLSPWCGRLHHGRVHVSVPPQARGFSLLTATTNFANVGSEFALERTRAGKESLQVESGLLDFYNDLKHETVASMLFSAKPGGTRADAFRFWQPVAETPDRFVDSSRLAVLARAHASRRYGEWQAAREQSRHHPDLVAGFSPELVDQSRLVLTDISKAGHSAAIVGCRRAEGRWPDKIAVEFKQAGDRVRFDIPGEFESITLMAWVRIDGFDREYNSIMLTDAFENGDIHWQINYEGCLNLGIKPPGAKRRVFITKPVLHTSDLGRWLHLAAVCDRATGRMTHYLDGRAVGDFDLSAGTDAPKGKLPYFPFRIGAGELGNWSPVTPGLSSIVRNLNGRIDEFSIYNAALSPQEILAAYEVGCP